MPQFEKTGAATMNAELTRLVRRERLHAWLFIAAAVVVAVAWMV